MTLLKIETELYLQSADRINAIHSTEDPLLHFLKSLRRFIPNVAKWNLSPDFGNEKMLLSLIKKHEKTDFTNDWKRATA